MNTSLRLLLLTAALIVGGILRAGAGVYQYMYITCVDTHGSLILRDTIKSPAGECFYLKAPSIPYYKCLDYDETGSNVCIHTSEHLTMTYETKGYTGFSALTDEPIETITENMSVALLTDENTARTWRIDTDGLAKPEAETAGTHSPDATWVLRGEDDGWALYNEMRDTYLTALQDDGTFATGNEPTPFTLTKMTEAGDNRYTLTAPDGKQLSVRLSKYAARPYFALYADFVDEKDSLIAPSRLIPLPAGQPTRFEAPDIAGFVFDSSPDLNLKDNISLDDSQAATFVYKRRPTALTRIADDATEKSSRRYDLTGRPVGPNHRGITLIGRRKVSVR